MSCPGCHYVRYCSNGCRHSDWRVHGLLCQSLQYFRSPPSLEWKRAIFFPSFGYQPYFVWLRFTCDASGNEKPDYSTLPEHESDMIRTNIILSNSALNRLIPYQIAIARPDGDTSKQLLGPPNKSLQAIDVLLPFTMRSSFVAFGMVDNGKRSCNLTPIDLRHIADYFAEYMYQQSLYGMGMCYALAGYKLGDDLTQCPRVQGVRLNCAGDIMFSHRAFTEAVEVPAALSEMNSYFPTPLAAHIGFELVAFPLPRGEPWRDRFAGSVPTTFNSSIVIFDPQSMEATTKAKDVGSLVVVRKDGKPLHITDVEAMEEYCLFIHKGYGWLSMLPFTEQRFGEWRKHEGFVRHC